MAIIKNMTASNRKALELIFLAFHRWGMHSEHRIKLNLSINSQFHRGVDGYILLLWKTQEYYCKVVC